MAVDCVCAQTDELGVPLCELRLELCEGAELGGADGSVVFGVGKEDDPADNVSDEAVCTRCFGAYQLSPMKSWNLIGPLVVSASKSGAVLPRRSWEPMLLKCYVVGVWVAS